MVELPDCPLLTVMDVGAAEMLKSGPDPDSATVCGLPVALSVKVSEAVAFPNAVGEKVIPSVHLRLGAMKVVVPQLLVMAKLLALGPVIAGSEV
jgi:hypothetical protein